ncbi:hypothetical protein QBC38DRAFT_499996 [Podospora fimiseda]|uniref:Tyrosinase copper-binding domain-containing protein n=1 Tax=Podospora fimiseda TaxID=252190 RepID=A0AAN7BNZ5_9PEZI|nr:hypothetical protein QBC38DRAFT_499996 [Podospora fimiseda]
MTTNGNIAITGVPTTRGSDGSVPIRRELRDMQQNYPDHFNLLILSLKNFQALYEQSLWNSVQTRQILEAAETFRAPYYDWASQPPAGGSAFPSILTSLNITIVDVDGNNKSTSNPLYPFTFHPVNPVRGDFPCQWTQYPDTVRYPRGLTSHDSRIAPILSNELASLRSNMSFCSPTQTLMPLVSTNGIQTPK